MKFSEEELEELHSIIDKGLWKNIFQSDNWGWIVLRVSNRLYL